MYIQSQHNQPAAIHLFLYYTDPDGIEDPSISVTFTNQKRGYYYRIRGAFSAGDDDWYEGFGPTTDGIWIE